MRRAALLLALLVPVPGCLAAAAGGIAYVVGKGKEADASKRQSRLDYVRQRRAAGATDEEILAEIRKFDPEWAKEIDEGESSITVPVK